MLRMASFLPIEFMVVFVTIIQISRASIQLSADSRCGPYEIYHVNEDKTYELVWNGGSISDYCKFGFKGQGEDIFDIYKVCVEVIEYDVKNCRMDLKYYFGFSSIPKKVYSCNGSPPKTCAKNDEYFDVGFSVTGSTFILSMRPVYTNSRIKLKVTAEKTYDNSLFVGSIVGGVIGGITLLVTIIVVAIVCICNRKRRNTPGYVYNARSGNPGNTPRYANNARMETSSGIPDYEQPPPPYWIAVRNGVQNDTYMNSSQEQLQQQTVSDQK